MEEPFTKPAQSCRAAAGIRKPWSLHKAMLPSAVTLASKATCLERDLLALCSPRGSSSLCWLLESVFSTKRSPALLFTLVILAREAAT